MKKGHEKREYRYPKFIRETPESAADRIVDPDVYLLNTTLVSLTSLCRFMANEIFYHPVIRRWIRNMYFERATISTEPTLKGKKDLDLYHLLYPAKRILKRPLKNFRDDLWLMMIEAEKKELIRVKF